MPDRALLVRPATEEDYPGLARLWRQLEARHAALQPEYFRVPDEPRSRRDLRDKLRRDTLCLLVACAAGDELVGALQVQVFDTPRQSFQRPQRRAYVEDIVVDDGARGVGVGRALMDAAGAWAADQSAVELVLTVWSGNDDAEAFYRSIGFDDLNRVMRKALP